MSSYEGRRAYSESGESLYEVVHITAQDRVLVDEYARQSAHLIADIISFGLDDVEYKTEGIEFTLKPFTTLRARKSFNTNALSCVCSYVMLNWLGDKLPERSNAWKAIYDGQFNALPKVLRKNKPVLVEDEDGDGDEEKNDNTEIDREDKFESDDELSPGVIPEIDIQ